MSGGWRSIQTWKLYGRVSRAERVMRSRWTVQWRDICTLTLTESRPMIPLTVHGERECRMRWSTGWQLTGLSVARTGRYYVFQDPGTMPGAGCEKYRGGYGFSQPAHAACAGEERLCPPRRGGVSGQREDRL